MAALGDVKYMIVTARENADGENRTKHVRFAVTSNIKYSWHVTLPKVNVARLADAVSGLSPSRDCHCHYPLSLLQ